MKKYSYEMSKYLPKDCIIKAYYSTQVNTHTFLGRASDLVRCGLTSFTVVDDRFFKGNRKTGTDWYDNFEKPPVGEICEAYIDNEWKQVKIVQHDGDNIVFSVQTTSGVEYKTLGSLLLYRPETKDFFTSLYELLEQNDNKDIAAKANLVNNLVKNYYLEE